MLPLTPTSRRYPWGSPTAIPRALGMDPDGRAVAEAWFGAHPAAPAVVEPEEGATTLTAWIERDPLATLGSDVVARFGARLPYLMKIIAADSPLSLQVHPDLDRARAGFAAEEAAGIARDAPDRSFPDANHKPELLYALSTFEAVCGFRAPRRAAELLAGLDTPLTHRLQAMLAAQPDATGVAAVFRHLLDPATRPHADVVEEVAEACATRLWDGSPSSRADRTVVLLSQECPGDAGAIATLLLNPVTLQAGEALFVPVGTVHAYLSGMAIEVMADSDNELRGGLTAKHIDVPGMLDAISWVAAPPLRIAPEVFFGATRVYYAPVDDFELSVTHSVDQPHPLPGRGPRVLLCLEGRVTVVSAVAGSMTLERGQAAFAPAQDGPLRVSGRGTLVQADVP
ncbi:MAG TPA: mannose-6-phosphate isomerase, class I [Actinotalea sp.]|nr:mannose-6-phosphate isomerase, class I [Actinotalea sp.]